MLLSAGLTPAWQQIMVFDSLRIGAVNRAREVSWHAQGKVLNAGTAAHHLGGPSLTLAPLGGLPRGEIVREFDALGVPHRFLETQAGTRVCTTLIDRATGATTELVENGRPLSAAELAAFNNAYAEEAAKAQAVVITGSLPEGTPPMFYRDLLEHTSCPAVLDFRGEGLLAALDLRPYIVKPNREELGQTVGMNLETDEKLLSAMRSLNRRGAAWVVVTDGPKPVWAGSATKLYRFHPLASERVVNAIGSGDALAAGLAWATRADWDIVRAVRFGIAAATDNLRQLATCRLDRRRVEILAEKVLVEELE
ncbi:MAG: bifunctional hydroxymethylpyrimidine kinase/phosphomethylpyrimidine kinase [Pirellulales bacterium]|nr:bifunctional hydroxymethylpyrimidine kinase/phosphomethylpyrimidine kinase [Pirellulales bacterium]